MLAHWIWLAHRPGLSDRMKQELLRHFPEPEDIYFSDSEGYDHVPLLTPEAKQSLRDKDLTSAQQILETCREKQIHLLTYRDAAYPVRLKNIADPPVLLYYKGTLPDIDGSPVIGVVGTRSASAYGLTTSKRMGYQIGKCGGVVVSGMARGIDRCAMEGCLTAGKPVIGILGCGADMVYPPSNQALFRDTERYGCILSEFAPGTPPAKWTFPKRNRIIAGLSCGVLVVEAPEKSGSLITARQALDQGRDVFVVPGNIDMPSFEGSNAMLRDGAIIVRTGWDVVSEYAGLFPDKIFRQSLSSRQSADPETAYGVLPEDKPEAKVAQTPCKPAKKPGKKEEADKLPIDNRPSQAYIDLKAKLPKLSEEEAKVVSCLHQGERLVDDVIAETGISTGKMLSMLTMLELKGVIRRLPGKRISLK